MDIPVYFTSDLTSSERRVSPQWTIKYLRQRLEQITGIEPKFQKLQYYPIRTSNESRFLLETEGNVADLNLTPYSRIHVIDTDPGSTLSQLKDDTGERFELSQEEYEKRSDSVLQWKKQNNLGRFDAEYNEQKQLAIAENEKLVQDMKVGSRCRVLNIMSERRGVIRYVGKIEELDKGESVWVGIEFDEPVGKNDGLIGDVRVFQARPKHGSFVRPKQVEVGDFPEEDLFSDDEEL